MPIIKIEKREGNYVTVSNNVAQSKDLTYEAKGMLTELLSRPKNWKLVKSQLNRKHTKEAKVARIVKELQLKGHLWLADVRSINNSVIEDRVWFVFETPKNRAEVLSYFKKVLNRENLSLREPGIINKDNNTNKEGDINKENNTITPLFDSLSKGKKDLVETIFDFWNLHKKSGRWQKHKKLTKDMVEAILTSLKDYSLEDICGAINNYAKVLQNEKYYWDYIWPLSTFLTVKEGKHKDDPRKWWRWLEENFVEENFLTRYANSNSKQGSSRKLEELPPDPDPELTELIVDRYKYWYRPKGRDFPNFTAQKHFILTTIKAKENYKLNTAAQKKNFVDEFFQIAQGVWSSKGEGVMPWDLSGTLMWDYKMPQYYQNMGIPESAIGEISENPLSESEFEVEKFPILGGKLEEMCDG